MAGRFSDQERLLDEQVDLSSDPQHSCKKVSVAMFVSVISVLGNGDVWLRLSWLPGSVERPCLK